MASRQELRVHVIRSQHADHLFQFAIKQCVIPFPADEVGGEATLDFRLLAVLVIRAGQEAVRLRGISGGPNLT
jgi:hypothetical protein